ncbi:MAG: LLM class flavin-dependent oxidoreductase [Chloroflexota bacterium]|nr:LLM class flavin-dependent oxidoreductase [Chloroflexota bacterium]
MRFGTFHLIGAPDMAPGERRIAETLEQIALADQLGLDHAWVAEHHFSNYGYATNPLLIIAKASALAPRIRFGQAILVTPFWHPIRLAEDIALTDILTGGRLDVGIGRGYQKMEFDGLDLRIKDSRPMFEEGLELMLKAWTEDDFTHAGRFFTVPRPITMLPRPVQVPHPPIWVACQSEQTVDWTAERGYSALFSGSPTSREQIATFRQRFVERWAAAGHAESPRIAVQRFVFVADSEAEAKEAVWQTRWQRRVADHLRKDDARIAAGRNDPWVPADEASDEEWWDRLVYGTPERCIAQLRRDAALGFTDFIGWFDVGGLGSDRVSRSMREFASEVMPALEAIPTG